LTVGSGQLTVDSWQLAGGSGSLQWAVKQFKVCSWQQQWAEIEHRFLKQE